MKVVLCSLALYGKSSACICGSNASRTTCQEGASHIRCLGWPTRQVTRELLTKRLSKRFGVVVQEEWAAVRRMMLPACTGACRRALAPRTAQAYRRSATTGTARSPSTASKAGPPRLEILYNTSRQKRVYDKGCDAWRTRTGRHSSFGRTEAWFCRSTALCQGPAKRLHLAASH